MLPILSLRDLILRFLLDRRLAVWQSGVTSLRQTDDDRVTKVMEICRSERVVAALALV